MLVFIINTILLIFSFLLIGYNFVTVKNANKNIETRIKSFVIGGIQLLVIGIVLVALSIIGSRELIVDIDGSVIAILIVVCIIIYIFLLFVWNKMFKYLENYFYKKNSIARKFKLKSISIYGLVYCFGVLFSLLYMITYF
ncbi:MAG: hypothetical protein WC006_03075 [Bacilli bacterium]|nr:hypothetical protein [Bacilli bacterium]